MHVKDLQDLVCQINKSLGNFCKDFAYRRKELAGLGKSPARDILFKPQDDGRDYAINEGGGTEIQYHIFYRSGEIGYGLGFNAQYVQFKNAKSPVDYIQPFADAFLKIKNTFPVTTLRGKGFHFIYGNENELSCVKNGGYYLFGKNIGVDSTGSFSDDDYTEMINELKGPLYDLYCKIFQIKNARSNGMQLINDIADLLKANKNVILTGAPGTGKTYLAKQLSCQIIFGKISTPEEIEQNIILKTQFNNQCSFVQFHPSYDYSDFVEGLRPTPPDENGNVGFARQDGIFKSFCRKAIQSTLANGQDNFESSWQQLVNSLNEKDFINVPNLSGKGEFEIELNEYGTGLASRTYASADEKAKHNWIGGHSKFFSRDQLYKVYQGLPGVPNGGHDNYRKAVINLLKKDYGLLEYKAGIQNNGEKQKFVFIIDEINRGDIAKIFGELFFALDPGYRGEQGRVETQYTNLIDENDIFKSGFYIPKNVYIIGTMNDIDRNVESMDFAIRRRFTWMEIKPENNLGMWDDPNHGIIEYKDNATKYMNAINNKISTIHGLGKAYQLGASYFLKLREYKGDFGKLWEYHIQPLLNEYLRGLPNAETEMKELERVWGGVQSPSSQSEADPVEGNTQA